MNVTKLRQRGDTIVEVLIAMTVASSVLGIAFATTNRNLKTTRSSQERSEATKIAQGQIEALRYTYNKDISLLPSVINTHFCINGSVVTTSPFGGAVPAASLSTENLTTGYPAVCIKSFYHYVAVQVSPGLFKFYVRWESLSASGRDEIIMVYKAN